MSGDYVKYAVGKVHIDATIDATEYYLGAQ